MTVLLDKTSVLFRTAVWLFVAVVFADAANLDDLFSRSVVLHSDEEAIAQSSSYSADGDAAIHLRTGALPLDFSIHRLSTPRYNAAIIILDQDSPSLEAEKTTSKEVCLTAPQSRLAPIHLVSLTELLYLKFRVLLI